jgi:DedD protein
MDRRVKERLVGASILVLLLVLIVPELLSGPKTAGPAAPPPPASAPEAVRNITVDLATSKPPAAEPAPEIPSAASAAGPTVTTLPAAAPPPVAQTAPVSRPSAPVVSPKPVESAPSSPTSTLSPAWAVQLGSFASRVNADKLAHQLKGQGFSVYVLSGGARASLRYRVRVGPLADRGAATQAVAKLKAIGHASSIVPPAS